MMSIIMIRKLLRMASEESWKRDWVDRSEHARTTVLVHFAVTKKGTIATWDRPFGGAPLVSICKCLITNPLHRGGTRLCQF